MALALQANFGSVARWRDEFVALGKALGGGSGWVLLAFQPREGTLVNQWAADHTHALAGGVPILALDMYEHAYHIDYGAPPPRTSTRSWPTSTGRRSIGATSAPCTPQASRSAAAHDDAAEARCCSTCGAQASTSRRRR